MTAPVASFIASGVSGRMPYAVQFTDASTNTPTSWLWDFGDGYTSTEQNPIHTYSQPGSFVVKLIATNASGSSSYNYPQAIAVSRPDFDLVLQVGGTDQGEAYLVGSFKASPKLGSKSTCSFSLFDPTIRPLFGHEVGIWDGNAVDEVRSHGAITIASGANVYSSSALTCGTKGTLRVVFSTSANNNTRQGVVYWTDGTGGIKIFIGSDNVLYVYFMGSTGVGTGGAVNTGVTPTPDHVYDAVVRWSTITGAWSIRLDGTVIKSGTGATFTSASSVVGIAQYSNSSGTNPLTGDFVALDLINDVLDDDDVEHLESWIPFPYADSRYIACWDFHESSWSAYVSRSSSLPGTTSTSTDRASTLTGISTGVTWTMVTVTTARKMFGGKVLEYSEWDKNLSDHIWYDLTCDGWISVLQRHVNSAGLTFTNFTPLDVMIYVGSLSRTSLISMDSVDTSRSDLLTVFAKKTYGVISRDALLADALKLVNLAFYIDAWRDIHIYDVATVNCPISLTDDSNNYRNLKVRRSGANYANHELLATGTMTTTGGAVSPPWYKSHLTALEDVYNWDMISAMIAIENGGSGHYYVHQSDTTITDEAVAVSRCVADITKYGVTETITFDTFCHGIEIGQVLSADITAHDVDGSYLITSISISDVSGLFFKYSITAVKGVYQFQWVDYFKNLGQG